MSKRARLMKVAPDFDELMRKLQQESKDVLGKELPRTVITERMARKKISFVSLFGLPSLPKKGKKGQVIVDFVVFTILIIGTVLTMFVLSNMWSDGFSKPLEEINTDNPTNATTYAVNELDNTFEGGMDWLLPAAAIILLLGLIGSVFLLDTTPVFFVIMLILAIIFMVLVPMISNFTEEIMDEQDFATTKGHYPITYLMIQNWAIYVMVSMMLTFVAFFAKSRI